MIPAYHQNRSTSNHYALDVSWDTASRTLRIAPFSGRVAGHDFSFVEEQTYVPNVGVNRVTLVVYLAWNPTTSEAEIFVDERHPDAMSFSPKNAGYENLAVLVWADWRAGEVDPFSFNASSTALESVEVTRG
jgi:hypothetical protein